MTELKKLIVAIKRGVYATGFKICLPSAEQGDADAQFKLGFMYAEGKGVPQDYGEAMKWYRKAAEQGDTRAQNNLGLMYADGLGVAQDDGEAVKWCRKAAEQGDADAQCNLGRMYAKGRGVPQDDAEAVKWYRKAAEQGDATAQAILGFTYKEGQGVAQDDAEAMKWFRKGVEQGVPIRPPTGKSMDPIAEIKKRLTTEQSRRASLGDRMIEVAPPDADGFTVGLFVEDDEYIVYSDELWHEHISEASEAVEFFMFCLGPGCRLKITSYGSSPQRGTLEVPRDGQWNRYSSTTRRLSFPFWRRKRVVYKRNGV